MKKRIKNIISLVLVIALAISGITYTTETKADEKEDSWKTNAVKVPSEGQLVGAGYIDVEFDNSMEGYTYLYILMEILFTGTVTICKRRTRRTENRFFCT